MPELPSGTMTFVFTDVEGSTRLLRQLGERYGAVLAAVAAQRPLLEHPWPPDVELRVRIGVHSGGAEPAGERYVGLSVHRAARICAAGHGGQILVSQATVALIEDEEELPELEFRDLGEQRFKDFDRPVRVH